MKTFSQALCLAVASLALSASAQIIVIPAPLPPDILLDDRDADPIAIRSYSVEASIHDLYAKVTTTIGFYNPNGRVLEGELRFPLPDGASVCGYALDIDGAMVDAVVVEKEAARVAFEGEVRRGIDPGLVEHVRGNVYNTRVYPLPAHGTRTVRLSYVHPLPCAPDAAAIFNLPMPRSRLDRQDVRIEVARPSDDPPAISGLSAAQFTRAEEFWRVESHASDVDPGADLSITLPPMAPVTTFLQKDKDGTAWFSVSAAAPDFAQGKKDVTVADLARPLAVYWDASASRADADLKAECAFLSILPANICTPVTLRVFRNDGFEPPQVFDTPLDLVAALKDIPYDGATALSRIYAHPADIAAGARILLFSDGIDTMAAAGELPDFSAAPGALTAIVSQTQADRELLRQLAGGALIDLQALNGREALPLFLDPPPRVAALTGSGIADLQGVGAPAVGRVRLLGRLEKGKRKATVRIAYSDGSTSGPIVLDASKAVAGELLPLAWAAARVNQLSPKSTENAEELLAIGRRYGLVSPATSLLVLESLDQWMRYRIEPPDSLPDLRRQYRERLKGMDQDNPEAARRRHLEQVAEWWGDRVHWWTDPERPAPGTGRGRPLHYEDEPQPRGLARRMFGGLVGNRVENRAAMAEVADEAILMEAVEEAPMMACDAAVPVEAGAGATSSSASSSAPVIAISPWNPKALYLASIRKARSTKTRYSVYLKERAKDQNATSPAFFLDCATVLFKAGDTAEAVRVLSNLAEMKLESAPLLRVLAWRLQQAGALDEAIGQLRRIVQLRGEEGQSFRDLAVALVQRGNDADLSEAAALFAKVATTPWNRHADTLCVFALEEFNALRALHPDACKDLEALPENLSTNLDLDLRIALTWDADATDIDLHVLDPTGEEAYYGHNRTHAGGLVSRDVVDGYGPEEFLLRNAPVGEYKIYAKYYGSHQQTLIGPVTVTATVYTDWGRPAQQRQILTLRLEDQKDYCLVGTIQVGGPAPDKPHGKKRRK